MSTVELGGECRSTFGGHGMIWQDKVMGMIHEGMAGGNCNVLITN